MAGVELNETTEPKNEKKQLKDDNDKINNDDQKEKKLIVNANVQENPLRKTPLTEDVPEDPPGDDEEEEDDDDDGEGGKKKKKPKKKNRRRNRTRTVDPLQEVIKKMSCFNIVGCGGWFILSLILSIAALHFSALFFFTKRFTYMNREGIWIFLFLGIIFVLLVLYFVVRWKKLTITWLKRNYDRNNSRRRNQNPAAAIMQMYNKTLGIEKGKYYLWRLYLFEFIENWIQYFNMRNIYLCTLPLALSTTFSAILIAESSYRAYVMARKVWCATNNKITVREKDIQLAIDIFVDSFFLVVPIGIAFLAYDMWLSVEETTWMLFFPTLSLLGKLRRIMIENLNQHAEKMLMDERDRVSFRMSTHTPRRRKSLFGLDFNEKIAAIQNKHFPRWAKLTVFILSVVYVLLLLVTNIVQLASISTYESMECHEYISDDINAKTYWDDGCKIPVPYCTNSLEPSCNCAALNIENHNMSKLADTFVELTALRIVFIRKGPLAELPAGMEKLISINRFDVSFNNLQEFNVDILKWGKLNDLKLMYNNISEHNENLWKHKELVNLMINNNNKFRISESLRLPRLTFLNVAENNMSIPGLDVNNIPSMNYLYLSGNILGSSMMDELATLKDSLADLGIARCQLTDLKGLELLKKLIYLDARNNNITSVSAKLKALIEGYNNFESYFAGNPVCATDMELDCEPLCSEHCGSRKYLGDGICDESCDSKQCNFDGGDCV